MIIELMEKDFHKVKHLFDDRPFIHSFRSQLERIPAPKQVFVDSADDPQTAVIVVFRHWDLEIWLFFGGRADNIEFNKEFRKMVYEDPILKDKEENFVKFYCELSNSDWEEGILSCLKDPFLVTRYYHEIKELKLKNWRDLIPEGFSVVPFDLTFMEKEHLKGDIWYNSMINIPLRTQWFPFEECLKDIRGYVLVREEKEVVSFCVLGDLTEDNEIEVYGIGTKAEYQRRGFASIVGAATAEYCLPRYKSVQWHCTSTNVGSYKTAEMIGYERIGEYKQARVSSNQANSWVVNGFLTTLSKVLEPDSNNLFLLHQKAYLLAKLNRKEESIKIIQDLIERESHDGNLYDTYGHIFLIFHDYEKAIRKFQKALELEPTGFFTQYSYIKMAECYKELGNYEKAIEYAKNGRQISIERKDEESQNRAEKILHGIDTR